MKIIDTHVHHRPFDPSSARPDVLIDQMKLLAQRNGIGKVLLLSIGIGCSPEELQKRNDATLKLVEEDPDFFLGAPYLNPEHDPEFIEQEAVRCVRAGCVGIKQHMDRFADHASNDTIARVAAELDVPIVWHAWYKKAQSYPNESNGAHIARLAARNPGTKFVMAHLTGVGRRGVQDVAHLPNVWVDTSGCWAESGIVEYAVRLLGADRVVYGSDYIGRDYAVQLARVLDADITEPDRERILWKNAAKLLKLDT